MFSHRLYIPLYLIWIIHQIELIKRIFIIKKSTYANIYTNFNIKHLVISIFLLIFAIEN